jgi:sn-glycerol 3-phosphate transport system substrate-binding protein
MKRVLRRRRPIALAALAAVGLTAVACTEPPTTGAAAGQTGADAECPLDALEAATEPVQVSLWYGGISGPTEATMTGMAERFNASQDDVVVTTSNQGASYAEVYRKYESAASAQAGQLPEIVYLEDTQLQAMVDGGNVLPAQVCMEADGYDMNQIEPVVRANYTIDDLMYPGYANVSTPVLYYNKAHWAEAGLDPEQPPRTLDELYEQALALKRAGVSNRPFVLKLSQNFFKNWLNAVGVPMVNEGNGRDGQATEAAFDTPQARELLEFLRRMNDEGLLNLYAATEGGINHYLALAQEESSMLVETSTASLTIAAAVGGQITADEAGIDFDASSVNLAGLIPGAAPFPGIEEPGQVIPGGGAFFILNSSDPAQQAGAWKFLQFMLQPENAREWHTVGAYLPIVTSVKDDPDVQRFWREDLGGLLLHTGFEQLQDANPEQPGPLIGPYVDFTDTVERMFEAVMLDGADIDDSLRSAQEDVTTSLERYSGA